MPDDEIFKKYVLETEIINTGTTICKERQNMLFVPFNELKQKQNYQQVKDFNVGMGLSCSWAITNALGGDLCLKRSKDSITNFGFRLPVLVRDLNANENISESNYSIDQPWLNLSMIHGQKRSLTAELQKYYNKRYNLKAHNQLDIQIKTREIIDSFGPETQQSLLSHFSNSSFHDDSAC